MEELIGVGKGELRKNLATLDDEQAKPGKE